MGNIGHFDNEIDMAGLRKATRAGEHQAAVRRVRVPGRPPGAGAGRGPAPEPRLRHRPPVLRDVELVHQPGDGPARARHARRDSTSARSTCCPSTSTRRSPRSTSSSSAPGSPGSPRARPTTSASRGRAVQAGPLPVLEVSLLAAAFLGIVQALTEFLPVARPRTCWWSASCSATRSRTTGSGPSSPSSSPAPPWRCWSTSGRTSGGSARRGSAPSRAAGRSRRRRRGSAGTSCSARCRPRWPGSSSSAESRRSGTG